MAAPHESHEPHDRPAPAYRKNQALICILVFVCIVVAFAVPGLYTSVGAILAACVLIAVAAKMQPAPPAEEHH
jgi:hypothetical protein|uniref:Uncharacterized protein n=1 Tax=Desulfobacca acetoxidans TaxID=60893 RepID=A0A7C3V7L0_9BACT